MVLRCFTSHGWLGNLGFKACLAARPRFSQPSAPYLLVPRHPLHALIRLTTSIRPSQAPRKPGQPATDSSTSSRRARRTPALRPSPPLPIIKRRVIALRASRTPSKYEPFGPFLMMTQETQIRLLNCQKSASNDTQRMSVCPCQWPGANPLGRGLASGRSPQESFLPYAGAGGASMTPIRFLRSPRSHHARTN